MGHSPHHLLDCSHCHALRISSTFDKSRSCLACFSILAVSPYYLVGNCSGCGISSNYFACVFGPTHHIQTPSHTCGRSNEDCPRTSCYGPALCLLHLQ